MGNANLELSDVLRAGFGSYCHSFGPLPKQHYDVANAIMACRTAVLGGHVFRCDQCGHHVISYNSCRNRHCPTCQARARARWVDARTSELLPVPYFHVVFTVPSELNPFALRNKEPFYNILFRAASETLTELGRDPKRLGADVGFIAVLHTWGQNLLDHPHLHCIVPGGGLQDDEWVACPKHDFLFPVKVIASLFRGKFLDLFKAGLESGAIDLPGTLQCYRQHPALLSQLLDTLYHTDWVVYSKPPFGGAGAVIKYLGRYSHRIAISNRRIVSLTETHVSFLWKDYSDNSRVKVMTLVIVEFIRRFMLHVLPSHFVRIRYYGFLSARSRKEKLQLCRDQTGGLQTAVDDVTENPEETSEQSTDTDKFRLCPVCGKGHMVWYKEIPKPESGGVFINAA